MAATHHTLRPNLKPHCKLALPTLELTQLVPQLVIAVAKNFESRLVHGFGVLRGTLRVTDVPLQSFQSLSQAVVELTNLGSQLSIAVAKTLEDLLVHGILCAAENYSRHGC